MISRVFSNNILNVALLSWMIAQILKFFINLITLKRVDLERFIGSGGMPSSHSATVTSLTMSIGLNEGISSPFFAIALILTLIVTYDASGVRRAAGEHAKMINRIVEELEENNMEVADEHLKELLGHSKIEVLAGAVLGIIIAVLYWLFIQH